MDLAKLAVVARSALDRHGLTDWGFEFDDEVERFGACHHHSKKITMSYLLATVNNEKTCIETLLHEIAHALVGSGHGHGFVWRMKALQIGCLGTRNVAAALVSSLSNEMVERIRGGFTTIKKSPESFSMLELPCSAQVVTIKGF